MQWQGFGDVLEHGGLRIAGESFGCGHGYQVAALAGAARHNRKSHVHPLHPTRLGPPSSASGSSAPATSRALAGADLPAICPAPSSGARDEEVDYARELVVGHWGLIPWFATEPKPGVPDQQRALRGTVGQGELQAAVGTRGSAASFLAMTFDEPNWETGRNVWWSFRRADGAPCGLAGPWNVWTDKL